MSPKVIHVRVGKKGFLPIIIWSGSLGSIPSGYVLCDGTAGTLDLRDAFIELDPFAWARTASGNGVVDVAHEHRHYIGGGSTPTVPAVDDDDATHTHALVSGVAADAIGSSSIIGPYPASGGGDHGHTLASGTLTATAAHRHDATGSPGSTPFTIDTRPPFYALAYIKATAPTDSPIGTVVMVDDLTALPGGYAVCDGTGGTPDLLYYTPQAPGANLALLETFDADWDTFSHDHTSGYTADSATHKHTYTGGSNTDAAVDTSVPIMAGLPNGIVQDGHIHEMALLSDESGDHAHTMTFSFYTEGLTFYRYPPQGYLIPVIRLS